VHRLLVIFMCLLACLSLGRGSLAHAMAPDFAEFVVGAGCNVHRDGGQAHASSCGVDHKATQHHHAACHGHRIGIPPDTEELVFARYPAVAFTVALAGFAPDRRPDVATRPPTA
jgi:hypothetical protein